jgi:hypothetical protein
VPVITHTVQLYAGATMFSATPAAIDIDEERKTFTLSTIDAQGNRIDKVFDAPLSEVEVRGQATRLRFNVGGVRRWVDFSIGASMVQGFGIAGEIAGGVMNKSSGVNQVVAALRAGGAQVRYWSYWKRIGVTWAIVGGLLIVIIVIIAATALSGQ